jgi:hypothetical protein
MRADSTELDFYVPSKRSKVNLAFIAGAVVLLVLGFLATLVYVAATSPSPPAPPVITTPTPTATPGPSPAPSPSPVPAGSTYYFTSDSATGVEGTMITVTIGRDESGAEGSVVLDATSPGWAWGLPVTLSFLPGATTVNVEVGLKNDPAIADRHVALELKTPSPGSSIGTSEMSVTIIDRTATPTPTPSPSPSPSPTPVPTSTPVPSPLPVPVASFRGTPTSAVGNVSVQFTDLSTGADRWLWEFGDGQIDYTQNPLHMYSPGTYTVTLTVWNQWGSDWETRTGYVVISTPTLAPTATPTMAPEEHEEA